MASTNKTTNYDLSQYIGSDKPTYLGDYNSDMSKIDTAIKNNADDIESLDNISSGYATRIDDLETASTTQAGEITNINSILVNLVPIGTIVPFAGNVVPEKWLECNGENISRETYSDLYNVIGVFYGTGDGATTFGLPSLMGRVPVGQFPADTDFDTLGKWGGEKSHTLTTNEMPSHIHDFTGSTQLMGGAGGTGVYVGAGTSQTRATGGGEAHNNMQPYTVVKYIIKALN